MIRWLSNNIFAVERSLRVFASKFNHCSSVCPIGSPRGTMLAWYSGSGECQNDQSVHVVFIDGSNVTASLRIGDCTGNPVLVPNGENAVLLWSKFEDTGQYRRLADRWKTCSLWMQEIGVQAGEVTLLYEPNRIAGPEQHLLGRCNPLVVDDTIMLPLYDEVDRKCVIFQGEGTQYSEVGRFGLDMIQPTIWKRDGKICSLSRNFGSHQKRSRYCESIGGCWTEATSSSLWNLNSSLQVTTWNEEDIVLWNDTNGRWRKNMTIGVMEYGEDSDLGFMKITAEPITVMGVQHGSYPSMCVDLDGNLNFSFTNAAKEIEYHVWNAKAFKRRRDNPVRQRTRTSRSPRVKAEKTGLL